MRKFFDFLLDLIDPSTARQYRIREANRTEVPVDNVPEYDPDEDQYACNAGDPHESAWTPQR